MANERYKSLTTAHKNLNQKFVELKLKNDRLNPQINFNSKALEVFEDRLSTVEKSIKNNSDTMQSTIQQMIESRMKVIKATDKIIVINHYELVQTIITTQDEVQWRLTRLKEDAKKMFKEMESNYDLITDRIHHLESDVKNLNSKHISTYPT